MKHIKDAPKDHAILLYIKTGSRHIWIEGFYNPILMKFQSIIDYKSFVYEESQLLGWLELPCEILATPKLYRKLKLIYNYLCSKKDVNNEVHIKHSVMALDLGYPYNHNFSKKLKELNDKGCIKYKGIAGKTTTIVVY